MALLYITGYFWGYKIIKSESIYREGHELILIDKYEEGSAIEDTRLDGTFFKYEGDSTVYKLDNDKKRRVDSVEIIEAAGYRIDRITQVDSSEVYEDGEPYTLENARTK